MEIEVKKEQDGSVICEFEGRSLEKTSINLSKLLLHLGEYLQNGQLATDVAITGLRYAIFAIESTEMEVYEEKILSNLQILLNIYDAISESVTNPDLSRLVKELKEDKNYYEFEYNQKKRHLQLMTENKEEADRLILEKMEEITKLKEQLKELEERNGKE